MPRLSKSQRDDARREAALAEAQRLAALLSSAPGVTGEPLAPPAFINDARLAPALAVWRELAPLLSATSRLQALDRLAFAELCYWRAEWIAAVDDIQERGFSFMVRATSGGERPWVNPSVARRDTASDYIAKLSERFGLTPLDRIALNKNRGMTLDDPVDLFDADKKAAPAPEAEVKPPGKWSALLN